MNRIIFKRPVAVLKIIYSIGLFLLGIVLIKVDSLAQIILGLLFFAIGFYFLKRDGIEIDFDNKKYRQFFSLFNHTQGKWKDLPEVEYVSVFKTTETTRVWVSSASTNVTEKVIKVNLFYNNNNKITAYETKNIEKAFEIAKELASLLNVDILDATERESKWL